MRPVSVFFSSSCVPFHYLFYLFCLHARIFDLFRLIGCYRPNKLLKYFRYCSVRVVCFHRWKVIHTYIPFRSVFWHTHTKYTNYFVSVVFPHIFHFWTFQNCVCARECACVFMWVYNTVKLPYKGHNKHNTNHSFISILFRFVLWMRKLTSLQIV